MSASGSEPGGSSISPEQKQVKDTVMGIIKDAETIDIFRHGTHCVNQIAMRTLKSTPSSVASPPIQPSQYGRPE